MIAAMLITGILLLATLMVTTRCLRRLAGLGDLPVSNGKGLQPAKVSVIVPMRNESRNAKDCLETLFHQGYTNIELIAVDDSSSDNTLRILEEAVSSNGFSHVVAVGEKPAGWIGKSYAAYKGALQATGDWLLFVDADTRAEPQLVDSLVDFATTEELDFISLFPKQELGSFSERLVQPLIFLIFATAFPAREVNDPKTPVAAANGQCIFVKRSTYLEIGGHQNIKGSIVEDLSLANLVKSNGFKLRVFSGKHLIRTRMYTNSLELYEGWRKNLFVGAGLRWRKALGFVTTALLIGATAPLSVALFILAFYGSTPVPQSLAGTLLFWALLVMNRTQREFSVPFRYVCVTWLGALIAIGIMLSSAVLTSLHLPVSWKGRGYDIAALEASATEGIPSAHALLNPVGNFLRRVSIKYLNTVRRLLPHPSTNR